ncbi:MAG: EAL domain-containing protein [Burkholderiales bacterium]|nr:EAL domain-containing protein [Burkholderiales bacterium]
MSNTVLIITNSADDAKILHDTLARAKDGPFVVHSVQHLSDGLARLKQGDIDIVLADFNLPDSQGIATFDVLFKYSPPVPIMMLCNEEEEDLAAEAVQRGAQGFLSKGHFPNSLVPQALRSIIQRKGVEEALFVEKERARVTLESIGDGVVSTDVAGNVTYLNKQAEHMTGWLRGDAAGRPVAEVLHCIDRTTRQSVRNPVEQVIQYKKLMALSATSVLVRRDGYESSIEDSVAPIFDKIGEVTGAVIVFHDISQVQAMAQQMADLAQHDYLTGLPNRMLLNDRLTQAMTYAKRHGTQLAVLFMDLDNFKHINDSLGHLIGDKLLESVAHRLNGQVRQSDTVCRQGGDEFVILLLEDTHAENAAITAEKIVQSLAQPHHIDEHELHITTSIGISLFPTDGIDADTLVKNADTAMYHAKKKGRNNYQFFKNDMNIRAVERQSIEADLRRAIDRQEFILHYQPKVNLKSGEIIGAEALIRWNHPSKGTIFPNSFISIAEDCGLIIPIGRLVLRQACKQAKEWINQGMPAITVAVNISALEFRHQDFFKCVREILQETGLDAGFLQLELTESVLMRNVESSTTILQALKEMGVQLAVDDFGTGYSSLSYLNQFPIDVLKIDQSFVRNISANKSNGVIVSAVISMGASLNQRVIAEGIETQEQLSFLNAQDCSEGQGYFFGWPTPPQDFAEILLNQKMLAQPRE